MFFAKSPTDHFGVYESGPDGSYTATAMKGPKMYMPPPTAYVAKYEMSSSAGEEDAMTFTYFSSAAQMMTLAIPGVVGPESTAGSLKLLLSIQARDRELQSCPAHPSPHLPTRLCAHPRSAVPFSDRPR